MGLRDKNIRSLASYQDVQPGEMIEEIDPALVDEHPQIRTVYAEEDEIEFAAMLKRLGQQQPAIIRPNPEQRGRYIVVFGHRRRRAAIRNGAMLKAVVRDISEKDAWAIQWSENIDRKQLSNLEIGRAIQKREADLGSLTAVAEETGKSIAFLSKYRRFAEAADVNGPARELIESGLTDSVDTVTEVFALQSRSDAGAERAAQFVSEFKADPLIKARDRVRELNAEAKEAEGKPARSKASQPEKGAKPDAAGQDQTPPRAQKPSAAPGSLNDLLMTVYMKLIEDKNGTVRKAMNAIGDEGKEKIERALKRFYSKGHTTTAADYSSVVIANLSDGTFGQDGAGLFHMVAFMEGKLGEKDGFDLTTILNKAKAQPNEG
ncbi:ParB/RepB/Spo0J family partition protein [Burkholderia vietnamiensis]|uniref:ParB/RepB/Spo0J family partition protein n=1 Tax=Burkholderia vietnamiensis TaxID=60552 RepID=UPI001CF3B7AC|nr:ParB/RepB/Spo0J family partition protein [Burkholderia vietnamiensis]MCA8270372.1 ParB/RepB/Spo0J family partition protein [Burkholderia vietnamiensis]